MLSRHFKESSECILTDSSVYTAELTALNHALELIQASGRKKFIIFSDSLSALEAISGRNLKHPELLDFLVKFSQLNQKGYDIILAWVPGHVGIRENEIADAVAKEATSKGLITSVLPFSDLKLKIHSYTHASW